jgi:hypothetical protein
MEFSIMEITNQNIRVHHYKIIQTLGVVQLSPKQNTKVGDQSLQGPILLKNVIPWKHDEKVMRINISQ